MTKTTLPPSPAAKARFYALAVTALTLLATPIAFPILLAHMESTLPRALDVGKGRAWNEEGVLQVYADSGGVVVFRMGHVLRLERNESQVQILGVCASACTLYARLETACTSPHAIWMFHRARKAGDPNIFEAVLGYDPLLARLENTIQTFHHRDPSLGAWQANIPPGQDVWLLGEDIVTAGWIKPCPGLEQLGPPSDSLRATLKELNAEGPMEASALASLIASVPRQK